MAHGTDARQAGVPDVVAPPPKHPRFPLSDGLRALPAVAILFGHAWLFSTAFAEGFTGSVSNRLIVRIDGLFSLFFLLSAFLLYRPMIAHRNGGPAAPRFSDYGFRRFLRIYPAYWVALTALAIFPGVFGAFSGEWWAFYSLLGYLDPSTLNDACPGTVNGIDQGVRCGLPQSWSFGLEVTFYFVLPFYALLTALLWRALDVRRWMWAELGLLALLSALSLILGGAPFDLREQGWYEFSFAGHFYWFALGLAIAIVSVAYQGQDPPRWIRFLAARPVGCWGAGAAIYLFTAFAYYPAPFPLAPLTSPEYMSLNVLQGLSTALLFIPAVFGNPNRGIVARFLTHPVVAFLGVISYGIVLWHVTIMVDLGAPGADADFGMVLLIGTILTIPLAALSYLIVERPLMKLKSRSLGDIVRRGGRRVRDALPSAGRSA